jgi:SNF2 family DNA or RNA helicase
MPYKVGALFMEMGTGKTRAAMEIIRQSDADLIIWICPFNTKQNAQTEINKWGGMPAPLIIVGIESIQSSDRIYLDIRASITAATNPFIVVDESIKIKNITAKRTQRLFDLGNLVQYKLILNGTPLSKSLLDIWSQMHFLSPQIINMSYAEFKNTFCEYTKITKQFGYKTVFKEFITGYENIDYLYSLIRHYIFEANLNLSINQYYTEYHYILDEDIQTEYTRLKEEYLDNEKLKWLNNNIFLELTQKMQHLYCCTSEKFTKVNEWFATGIDATKTIIFCKYIKSQEQCAKAFPTAKIVSYQKDSFGLNLQDYPNTIFWDKNWDYALRKQSIARNFRTGQEYDCKYLDLTGNVGLEDMIKKNIDKKISMVQYFNSKTKKQIIEEL